MSADDVNHKVREALTYLVHTTLDREPDASYSHIATMMVQQSPGLSTPYYVNLLHAIYIRVIEERGTGLYVKQRKWGWYSESMADTAKKCAYHTVDGREVVVTCISIGPTPVDPYEGRASDARLIGELDKPIGRVPINVS